MCDHDELKRLAEAAAPYWHAANLACGGNPIAVDLVAPFVGAMSPAVCSSLLSEIAALRGERDTWKAMAENGAGGIIAHIERATQAERQRDELRKALERISYTPDGEDGLSLTECVNIARQALANQGADQ